MGSSLLRLLMNSDLVKEFLNPIKRASSAPEEGNVSAFSGIL
jgi:hypothetical protein